MVIPYRCLGELAGLGAGVDGPWALGINGKDAPIIRSDVQALLQHIATLYWTLFRTLIKVPVS